MRYPSYRIAAIALSAFLIGCGQVPLDPKIVNQASVLPAPSVVGTTTTAAPTVQPTAPPTPSIVPTVAAPTVAPTTPPAPTATVPVPTPSPAAQDHAITITSPQPNQTVTSPMEISGSANYWPFEATLVVELKDASGNVIGRMPVMVQAPDVGQGGPWSDRLTFTAPEQAQEGTLSVFEASMKDGSITTITSVKVRLAANPINTSLLTMEEPTAGATATLPLHVAFGGGRGDEQFDLQLTFSDGSVLKQTAQGSLGYVVTNIDGSGVPGPATLEVRRTDGTLMESRQIEIAAPEATQTVRVAWLAPGTEETVLEERSVPRSPQIATAALNELLWGPTNVTDYATSLPSTAEIMTYSGRTSTWGARVRLLKLTITDGVATANFSPELQAYGGGSARAAAIRNQIETTLLQFPSVRQVVIAVDGQTEGVLQP